MLSKCKEYFFIRFMTSRINYVLLFMLIKTNVQKETSFSHTKPWTFSRAFHFETKGHLMTYFHWRPHYQTQEQIISFPRKNNQRVARFQKQIVLGSHRNNFCFQNARSGFQALFSTHIPSPKWKKMREWSFKTIICLNSLAKHTWGQWPVQGGNIVF